MSDINIRIKYYKILHKYIQSRNKYINNCIRLYKYTSNKTPIYRIGNRIILDKQIGNNSAYGSIFLSHYRFENKAYNKQFGKLFKFATKIADGSKVKNVIEYNILKDLTAIVIKKECPHFPISFGKLTCNKQLDNKLSNSYKSDEVNSFDKQGSSSFKSLLEDMPKNIYGISNLIISLNELADNDCNNFIKIYYKDNKIIWNAIVQIFLSIMFFHKYINAFHRDGHSGNFLYHETIPGGYYHYNIYGVDFYLENIGFLWVIWDFGLVKPFPNSKLINNNKYGISNSTTTINIDYFKILKDGFRHKNILGGVDDKYMFSDNINFFIDEIFSVLLLDEYRLNTDINDLPSLNKELINKLVSNLPYNTFKTEINSNDIIINVNKPYII